MATVPELQATARELGITGYSRLRKPELEAAIARKREESDSDEINSAEPTATPSDGLSKAQRASMAGARGVSAQPMDSGKRQRTYCAQNGSLKITPAQRRRTNKKIKRLTSV